MQRLKLIIATLALSLSAVTPSALAQDADIKILAVNDLHAAVQNMPKLAYVVDSIRAIHPDALLFAAGDIRTGNPVNDMYTEPNLPMVDMMNAIGFNMSTMGNHECDGGVASFANTINKSHFPYVVANVYPADSLGLHLQPFRLWEHQGVRIGVLGLIQLNEAGIPDCHPAKVEGIRFTDPFVEADKYSWLRGQCDVYIGLTHFGVERDTLLAERHPEFDLLVCGHSHDLVPGTVHNGVMMVQGERWALWVNEVDLKVRGGKVVDRTCKTINVKAATGASEKVAAMVEKYSDNPTLNRVLAQAVTPFEKTEELGSMMADGQRAKAQSDLAIVNAGGVRYYEKPAGDITVGDILRLDPFGNELTVVKMTGEQLAQALCQIPNTDEYGPAFVSGFRYAITQDKRDPSKYTVRLMDESGKKLNMKKTYTVSVNTYVASVTPVITSLDVENLYITSADALIEYLDKVKTVDYKGVKRVEIQNVNHR